MARNSPTEFARPFIFQLPATSGRRPAIRNLPFAKSVKAVSRVRRRSKDAGLTVTRRRAAFVATPSSHTYDARPSWRL
jgi:hypothetical protein